MKRKMILIGVTVLAALFAGAATTAGAAYATGTTTVNVVNSPDDTVAGAPWARDTFSRATSVNAIEGGYVVSIWDTGTFKTPAGVVGKLDGTGTWTITGGTATASTTYPSGTIDRSGIALKDSFTGDWWKRFVDGGEVKTFTWEWKYKSTCWKPGFSQLRIESSAKGTIGGYPTKVCPEKPVTSPPTTSPAQTDTPTTPPTTKPTQGDTTAPTTAPTTPATTKPTSPATTPPVTTSATPDVTFVPAGNDTGGNLPTTGAPAGLLIAAAAAMVGIGGILTFLVRRRKVKFAA